MELKSEIRAAVKSVGIRTSFGQIESLKSIGEGGNSLVYAGSLLKQDVAVKLLSDEGAVKLQRFKAEYLNLALLDDHGFIAKSLFYEELDLLGMQVPCIVMKLYESSLKRDPAGDLVSQAKLVFKFLLDSLNYIHINNIIHRDLKPQNILVAGDGFRLADFGIASFRGDSFFKLVTTKPEERLANYLFSAPEQLRKDGQVGPWSDIYSMGQIIQWIVTGEPHRGTSRRSFGAKFGWLDKVVGRCLTHNAADRFQNISEIWDYINEEKQQNTIRNPWVDLREFSNVLAKTFPKIARGFLYSEDLEVVNRFFENLNSKDLEASLAWVDGMRSGDFERKTRRIESDVWLIGNTEFKVSRIYGYVSDSQYANFIFLELDAMPGFNGAPVTPNQIFDSIGLVEDSKYISVDELVNGYAEIDGQIIELDGVQHEERLRYLQPGIVCICTSAHNAYLHENEEYIFNFVKQFSLGESVEEIKPKVINLFNSIRRNMREDVRQYL